MNSPLSRTLEGLSSSDDCCKESQDCPQSSPDKSEVVREMLSECLLEGGEEFGEDWVLENRPLSFSED